MKFTYFDIRGRAEAVMLLLIDSGIEFEHEVLMLQEWLDMKKDGKHGPPRFPFHAAPTLTYEHGARGGQPTVLAEMGAILCFLGLTLSSKGGGMQALISNPDAYSRLRMIEDASLFLTNRIPNTPPFDDQWLTPPARTAMLKNLILPYLRSMEQHLAGSFYPPLLHPVPSDGRTGVSNILPAAAAACAAINMVCDIYPHSLDPVTPGTGLHKFFPLCAALKKDIESRPRIAAWIASGDRYTEWTFRPHAKLAYIKEMAVKYDREMDVEALLVTVPELPAAATPTERAPKTHTHAEAEKEA